MSDRIREYRRIVCPVCDKDLADSQMGVHAHLRKHERDQEIDRSERLNILKEMFMDR